MATEKVKVVKEGGAGAVYGLGVIGAAIYYIQTAEGFWMGVVGLIKALLWPAFFVYEMLQLVAA
jgi:hypothetical protein